MGLMPMRSPRISTAEHCAKPWPRPGRPLAWTLCVGLVAAALVPAVAYADTPAEISVRFDEPRAFGYRIGDTVRREVVIDTPAGLRLDEESMPTLGRQGPVLELRSVSRQQQRVDGGQRLTLSFEYQIFASPPEPRTYELPTLKLRFDGGPSVQEVRVEAWPVGVSPLMPDEASARVGLGELRPDAPVQPAPTERPRVVLGVSAAVGLSLIAYLAFVYLGLPRWSRRQRPFGAAWRSLQLQRRRGALPADASGRRIAARQLHAALNAAAGRVLFAETVDAFIASAPRFEPLRAELLAFFERSRAAFFASPDDGAAVADDLQWLLDFAGALRNAERGSA
jgi:mxaA protein